MQEKKLREAAKNAVREYDSYRGDPVLGARYERGITPLKEALAATTEETEMEKLVAALTKPVFEIIDEHGDRWWTMPKEIFDEITTQFGEEEGDADRGD